MAESKIPTQAPEVEDGVVLHGFENTRVIDGNPTEVVDEGVVVCDSAGNPIALATTGDVAAVVTALTSSGALANGAQTPVSAVAVSVLAANASRKSAVIQNVGSENVCIGVAGVTAVTGLVLEPGDSVVLKMPFIHTGEVFAVRQTADSVVLAQEVT